MRAATIRDGEVLVAEHPDPEPGKGELLVRVRAAGLNRADLMQVQGFYPAPPGSPPDILGMELAGEVAALVTAPISKEWAARAGFAYPGHTEYLAAQAGAAEFAMMLAGPQLRVTVEVMCNTTR